MQKFQKGDKVIITAGKDKGRKGKILKVFPEKDRVTVKGLNLYKKHVEPKENQPGGIVEIERPIPTASIMILDKEGNPTRVGFKTTDAGKYRISKKTGKKL